MGIISWIIAGAMTSVVCKFIFNGKESGGFLITTPVAIAGAVGVGWLSSSLGFGRVDRFDIGSLVVAITGAVIVISIYKRLVGK